MQNLISRSFISIFMLAFSCAAIAQGLNAEALDHDRFRQLEEILPTPTKIRTASGAPGTDYWQQRVNYDIRIQLDEENKSLKGQEHVTYENHSPDTLTYLWMQLDDNWLHKSSDGQKTQTAPDFSHYGFKSFAWDLELADFDGRVKISKVALGKHALRHQIVGTMMRIDLDTPLKSGQKVSFDIEWHLSINDAKKVPFRTGYEVLDDGNAIFEIAHFYPRMVVYNDVTGWQHKQFLGRGEFTLEFGNFKLAISVPEDHIVAATGLLQNPSRVLNATQRRRLGKAKRAKKPMYIVTPKEAQDAVLKAIAQKNIQMNNSKNHQKTKMKTWVFTAKNVRDVAFSSSRTFVWDAMGHSNAGKPVLAMSFYPREAMPLWNRYSTQAIVHTLDVYSRYTFQYPYPVAISVNGAIGGMEYPMISFNGPRPNPKDQTYFDSPGEGKSWYQSKYGLISVVIHEVGHNYFPMIINTDERQWTWMDEGLNTFVQYLAEKEWQDDYPSWRGEPKKIIHYMRSKHQVPIMTGSDSILQFGNNAYGKPATALNILRETIMGPALFDFAFKEYARRWRFKRPYPADFFRTMEDASGMDLDWFWRGWFYSTDPVDIALTDVRIFELDTQNPNIEKPKQKQRDDEAPKHISYKATKALKKRVNHFAALKDFYNAYDKYEVTAEELESYEKFIKDLKPEERPLLDVKRLFYVVKFENKGGLPMPILLRISYKDGSKEMLRMPAQIWRRDAKTVSKMLMVKHEIVELEVDPFIETADIDVDNNRWPRKPHKSQFKLFKEKIQKNAMQKAKAAAEKKEEEAQKKAASKSKEGHQTKHQSKKAQTPVIKQQNDGVKIKKKVP